MGVSLAEIDTDQVLLTENLMFISKRLWDNVKDRYPGARVFRKTIDNKGFIITKVSTSELTVDDICTINEFCDGYDPKKNAEVKKIVGGAIDASMGNKDFQIVEFGGGHNLLPTNAPSHHTIEIDENIIRTQMQRGMSASTFEGMPEGTLRTDCPRIAPAIYSFHFMNPQHVEQISSVVSHDGFFIANCMKTHTDSVRPVVMQDMTKAFQEAGMKVAVVEIDTDATADKLRKAEASLQKAFGDSAKTARNNVREMRETSRMNNEFWVAAYDDAVLTKAVAQLQRSIGKNRPKLEVWNTRVLEAV